MVSYKSCQKMYRDELDKLWKSEDIGVLLAMVQSIKESSLEGVPMPHSIAIGR